MADEKKTRKKLATKTISEDFRSVTFAFNDDTLEDVVVLIADFPKDIVKQLAAHGVSQKLGDAYGGKGVDTALEAQQEVLALVAQLNTGEWRAESKGGGGGIGAQLVMPLFRMAQRNPEPMAQLMGLTVAEVQVIDNIRTWVVAQTAETRTAIGKSPEVVAERADMAREKSADAPSLFA